MHVFPFFNDMRPQVNYIQSPKFKLAWWCFSYAQGCCRKMPTCNPYWKVYNLTCQVKNAISSALCAILFIVWSRSLCACVTFTSYCWWKKSCTSWYGESTIIYSGVYIPGGAGFLPSTVILMQDHSRCFDHRPYTYCTMAKVNDCHQTSSPTMLQWVLVKRCRFWDMKSSGCFGRWYPY